MKVGDLIQDKKYSDLAVIIGEKPDRFIIYYMSETSLRGSITDEDATALRHEFRVVSSAKG
jgi:hypothetical protein